MLSINSILSLSIADNFTAIAFVPMGHIKKRSICGVTKTVAPAYIVIVEGEDIFSKKWGHVVDDGELETFQNKGDDANNDDLKNVYNVSEIRRVFLFYFKKKLLNLIIPFN